MKAATDHFEVMEDREEHLPSLAEYLVIMRKRKWTIFTIFMMIVVTVILRTYLIQPIYEGVTTIVIEKENPKVLSIEEVYSAESSQQDYYQTQYKILASRSVAKLVFDKLNLSADEKLQKLKDPIDTVQKWITIDPVRASRMVRIRVRHVEPKRAALIANTVAETYIQQNLQKKLDASRYAVDWLTEQMITMRQKVEQSEINLQKYIEENQIVHIPKIEEGSTKEGFIQEFEREKAKLETQFSEFSKRYKDKHPKIIRIKSSLESIHTRMEEEVKSVMESGRKITQFNILKREVESNRQLYDTIMSRAKETNLFEGLRVNNITIVDVAEVPVFPVYPNKRLNILLACVIGLFAGCGLAFLLESLDNTVKGVEDARNLTGHAVLGSIPNGHQLKKKLKSENLDLACHLDCKSPFSESYQFVKTGIFFSNVDEPAKTILITSSIPKEGKTTDVANLAITYASGGEKVLLIDADLRNPRIHTIFKVFGERGLTLLLTGLIKVNEAILATQIPNLFILPCGQNPPNPAELLGSQKMRDFLTWAKNNFDKIIIDTPPVLAVADPLILSSMVDGVIFTIRSGVTPRKQILHALNKMSESRTKILGVVLNCVRLSGDGYSYPYYYNDYYGEKKNQDVLQVVAK